VSVVGPGGFRAAGVAAGIKPEGSLDLAIVSGEHTTGAAAVFTVNRAPAAPIQLSRRHLRSGERPTSVVINSGCANAATGASGEAAALATAATAAAALGCQTGQVIVGSTGPIGTRLPLDAVLRGVETAATQLSNDVGAGLEAATAILTTDTVPKQVTTDGGGFLVGGMAKGAGMVRPDMATMISVLTTDAVVGDEDLDAALRVAVDGSFHGLNIDGCSSTNDMVVALASGASSVTPTQIALTAAISDACVQLAMALAADAERASRTVLLNVIGASTDIEARLAGRVIADSALVRASFFGGDANWGRIVAALGAGPVEFDVADVSVSYGGVQVARRGEAVDFDAAELAEELAEGDFTVTAAIGSGPGSATVITADLTPQYVEFNAEPS